jgi:hypothetical protein
VEVRREDRGNLSVGGAFEADEAAGVQQSELEKSRHDIEARAPIFKRRIRPRDVEAVAATRQLVNSGGCGADQELGTIGGELEGGGVLLDEARCGVMTLYEDHRAGSA